MAQITVNLLVTHFYSIRKILRNLRYYEHRRPNSNKQFTDIYSRQRARKKFQQELFKSDKRFAEFFSWIFSIQERLKIDDREFARLCGVQRQTISMWRNFDRGCGGHFPSKQQFDRLIRLEIVCLADVTIKKNKTLIRAKDLPIPNINIPKGRIRLKANVSY